MSIFDQLMQEEYDIWGTQPPEHAWCTPEQTRLEVEFLKRVLHLEKTDTVLDLQCSWGRHALMLGAEGYSILGVDISESMIAKARKVAASSRCTATFAVADCRNLRYRSQFDVITQLQTSFFEAWRPPTQVHDLLLGVRKALKSNGRYLFGWKDDWNTATVAEPRWRQVLAEKGITTYDACMLPFYDYGVAEQMEIVQQAGFAVVGMYNEYDPDAQYDAGKPGLIIIASRDSDDARDTYRSDDGVV